MPEPLSRLISLELPCKLEYWLRGTQLIIPFFCFCLFVFLALFFHSSKISNSLSSFWPFSSSPMESHCRQCHSQAPENFLKALERLYVELWIYLTGRCTGSYFSRRFPVRDFLVNKWLPFGVVFYSQQKRRFSRMSHFWLKEEKKRWLRPEDLEAYTSFPCVNLKYKMLAFFLCLSAYIRNGFFVSVVSRNPRSSKKTQWARF